jgi:hypothetical protein
VQPGAGVGVAENVSTTGAGVGQSGVAWTVVICEPDTRQPPLEPVSPLPPHAAIAVARQNAAAPKPSVRIVL